MKNRKPNRLRGFDYSSDNLYFVTACVHNRICCFGEIVGTGRDLSLPCLDISSRHMILNECGKIAEKQWFWMEEQYPYIVLHEFVVMPNHIHGIIEIIRSRVVGTGRDLSLQKIKSLSELMGAYKTTVSKQLHSSGFIDFNWQRSFYDHIIRNQKSYESISEYIVNNPSNWDQDDFFTNK